MSQDDDGFGELSAALAAAGGQNDLFHDCIHIPLREDRGFVEVKSWGGGERSVQLYGGSESRDLTVTPGEFSCAPDEAAERLLQRLAEYGASAHAIREGQRSSNGRTGS